MKHFRSFIAAFTLLAAVSPAVAHSPAKTSVQIQTVFAQGQAATVISVKAKKHKYHSKGHHYKDHRYHHQNSRNRHRQDARRHRHGDSRWQHRSQRPVPSTPSRPGHVQHHYR